jgi:hypothetical protein
MKIWLHGREQAMTRISPQAMKEANIFSFKDLVLMLWRRLIFSALNSKSAQSIFSTTTMQVASTMKSHSDLDSNSISSSIWVLEAPPLHHHLELMILLHKNLQGAHT